MHRPLESVLFLVFSLNTAVGCVISRPDWDEEAKSPKAERPRAGRPDPKIVACTPAALAKVEKAHKTISALLAGRYGKAPLDGTTNDLRAMQRLFDDGFIKAGDKELLKAVGLLLGRVWIGKTPLRWAMIVHKKMQMLVLNYQGTSVNIVPENMLLKRKEKIDLLKIHDSMLRALEDLKKRLERKR